MTVACSRCGRGSEACQYCETLTQRDWEAICDCGLHDFGNHLLDCEHRAQHRYVVADDFHAAELPR